MDTTVLINLIAGVLLVPIFTWLLKINYVQVHPEWFALVLSLIGGVIVALIAGVALWPPAVLLVNAAQVFTLSQIVFRALKAVLPPERAPSNALRPAG